MKRSAFPGRALLVGIALGVVALLALASPARAASGDLAWQRTYNGTGNGQDVFSSLARAPGGGVYVVGSAFADTYDFVAARYDAAGQRRWLRVYDGPGGGFDQAFAAATDRSGDLIEAGYVTTPANTVVIGVVKYDAAGRRRWVRIGSVPSDVPDNPLTMAVDRKGNIYIAGTEDTTTASYNVALIKYSASGAHRWTSRYVGPGPDIPTDIALDGAGNIYVAGYSYQGTTRDYDVLTLKFDTHGHRRWARLWNDANLTDTGAAIAVTKVGTVYVAGAATDATAHLDALVLKYAKGGALRWSRTYSGGGNTDSYSDLVLMANGDVTAAGSSDVGAANYDALVARYGAGGGRRWTKLYDGPDSLADEGWKVARDAAGAIYVAGTTNSNATGQDSLLLKYGGGGAFRWARTHSSTGNANDQANALAVVSRQSVYVAGQQAASSVSDGTLLRYRP